MCGTDLSYFRRKMATSSPPRNLYTLSYSNETAPVRVMSRVRGVKKMEHSKRQIITNKDEERDPHRSCISRWCSTSVALLSRLRVRSSHIRPSSLCRMSFTSVNDRRFAMETSFHFGEELEFGMKIVSLAINSSHYV